MLQVRLMVSDNAAGNHETDTVNKKLEILIEN